MRNHSLKPLWLLAIVAVAVGGLSACGFSGPPSPANPTCSATDTGHIITTVWSQILVAPGPRYGVGDAARANRIAYNESRCQAGELNSSGCVGLFQLCGHQDAWNAAYGQPNCNVNPRPGNPWCDAWAGYILWWNGGNPSWAPWTGDAGNYAYTTGPAPTGVLVVLKTAAKTRHGAIVTATGQPSSDVGSAGAYATAVDLWNFVRASLYAQSIIDAQNTVRSQPVRSGGGDGAISGDCAAMAPPGFPASIVQRESGGNPNAVNSSSGAAGCAQILPSHFSSGGACAGMSYQACWARLWNGGAGGSNWSQTGG